MIGLGLGDRKYSLYSIKAMTMESKSHTCLCVCPVNHK